jgi:uncharacterized protein (DUF433 family)
MGRVLRWRRRRQRVKSATLFELRGDPRDTPIYSVREAATYLGVPRSTLRHWIKPPKNGRAIIEVDPDGLLSFYNLLEAHILKLFLERKAWLRRIRTGVDTLRQRWPHSKHPLLEQALSSASGYRSMFFVSPDGHVENLSFGGQFEFGVLLKRYLSRIDIDHTGPYQLRPFGFQHVGLNHRVSGGRPVIKGTGILVSMIASRLRAGETQEALARAYRISRADVREARRYPAA